MSGNQPMSLRFTIALVLSIACLTTSAWADYQAGMAANNRGDYATALREWRRWLSGDSQPPSSISASSMPTARVSPRTTSKRGSGGRKLPSKGMWRLQRIWELCI